MLVFLVLLHCMKYMHYLELLFFNKAIEKKKTDVRKPFNWEVIPFTIL